MGACRVQNCPTLLCNEVDQIIKELDLSHEQEVIKSGPLLNPAIAFGIMIFEGNFSLLTIQYLLCPFAGSILALIFYEHIYVKTQEFLENGSEASKEDSIGEGINDFDGEIEPGTKEDTKNNE